MRFAVVITGLLILASIGQAADTSKSKIEELFIWKMSDELSLSPPEEKKFTELVKDLNEKKADLGFSMKEELEKMKSAKTDAEKTLELGRYRKALVAHNHLAEEELDKMKSLLGLGRLVKYLEIKQDMTNRLKNLLANPETPKAPVVLPSPKVIEE